MPLEQVYFCFDCVSFGSKSGYEECVKIIEIIKGRENEVKKERYRTSGNKKALNNQSFSTEKDLTAIKSNSKHSVYGMSFADVDIRRILYLRQSCACSGNTKTLIGGTAMFSVLDTFLNATPLSQGATLLFVGLLIWLYKKV